MATIVVTNVGASEVYCSDLYTSIAAGASVTTTRTAGDLSRMAGLHALVAAGSCTVAVTYSDAEKASGMVDTGAAASAAAGLGDTDVIRVPLVAGTPGTADDVTVYAVNTLPYKKLRVLDAYAVISTGIAGTLQVRSAAAGAGTLCAEIDSTNTGRAGQTATVTASQVLTNGASVGLFVRRSDRGVAGEVHIVVRPET